MLHWFEAPRSMLSNYFCKKQVLKGTFGEIWRIQIQIYRKTYFELKYGAYYLNNEVSAHRLRLVVQLSLRVAPPYTGVSWPESQKSIDFRAATFFGQNTSAKVRILRLSGQFEKKVRNFLLFVLYVKKGFTCHILCYFFPELWNCYEPNHSVFIYFIIII